MELSIIVPLYNEEGSVTPLYEKIVNVLDVLPGPSEIIFVDDGSCDNTFLVAEKLAATDKRLRVVKFRRNYGQTPAMAAGIDLARGRILVTMDGDLQNDPQDIPNLIAKIEEGYDIVVGWRFDRKDKLISRKIPSRIANWLIGRVTGVAIKDNGCSLKAFRADVIKQIPLYNEMHRFIPAMASIVGPRIAEIKVRHHARQFGESKYGLSRTYKVLLDLLAVKTIAGFITRPFKWFSILAVPFILLSILMFISDIVAVMLGAKSSLPITGSGLFFASLGLFLVFSGGFAELIVRTGDTEVAKFPSLTAVEIKSAGELKQTQIQTQTETGSS